MNVQLPLFCVVSALANLSPAQQFRDERLDERLPVPFTISAASALGDVDGDGDLDYFLADNDVAVLLLGDGFGNFVPAPDGHGLSSATAPGAASFEDLDGDGDLDLFTRGAPTAYYQNDGTGTFTALPGAIPATPSAGTSHISVADLDGDGDLDILIGSILSPFVLRNDGATFTDVTATAIPPASDIFANAVGDFDGDGDVDIAFNSGPSNALEILSNDGSGVFTNTTSGSLPAATMGLRPLALDADGDGDVDLMTSLAGSRQFWINDGTGSFNAGASLSSGQLTVPGTSRAIDLDGDSDIDVVSHGGGDNWTVLVNSGSGVFTNLGNAPFDTVPEFAPDLELGDLDGDGAAELLVSSGPFNRALLYDNDGTGQLQLATTERLDVLGGSNGLFVDYDGDGDPDLVQLSPSAAPRLLTNDGNGTFIDETALRAPSTPSFADAQARPIDLGQDGDLDLLFLNMLWENDGTGRFTDISATIPPVVSPNYVLVDDLDGDGDDDAIIWDVVSSSRVVLIQNASGALVDEAATRLGSIPFLLRLIRSADVDGDGDVDLLIGSNNFITPILRVFVNDGTGLFTDEGLARIPAAVTSAWGFEPLDYDADGDIDILLSPSNSALTIQGQVLENDGTGHFTLATGVWPGSPQRVDRFQTGDFDADGDIDFFAASFSAPSLGLQLFVNQGNGAFTRDISDRIDARRTDGIYDLDAADIDRDGDLDLVTGSIFRSRLFINRHLQFRSPYRAVRARPLPLRFRSKPGYATGDTTGAALLNFFPSAGPIPTPFGDLLVAPLGLLTVGPVTIPASTGQADLLLSVPDDPALVGFTLFTQGAVADLSGPTPSIRLAGLAVDVVE